MRNVTWYQHFRNTDCTDWLNDFLFPVDTFSREDGYVEGNYSSSS